MNVKALEIYLGREQRVGVLFQYPVAADTVITRFVADEAFIQMKNAPALSISYLANSPEEQSLFWRDVQATVFNGQFSAQSGWLLPAFFQNLLPEGVFRDHVAQLRGCDPNDHFELLAACGKDLPGRVMALPVELSRSDLARYVTQGQDALEMSVTADAMEEGVSLSGVQPKVGVLKQGERYVARTKDHDTSVIAKLPVVGQPLLPEVEELSLRLAAAAGVNVCEARLEPLSKLAMQHGYDLGDAHSATQFLAVSRYDRTAQGRVHCEDFAQVLSAMPQDKYGNTPQGQKRSYVDVAAVLLAFPSLGEPAVHELLRRLVVNEMLGNPDMHLKNMGLISRDASTPEFAPAYDIVAYAAFNKNQGHALLLLPSSIAPVESKANQRNDATNMALPRQKQSLSPLTVRIFCSELGLPEKPAATVIKNAVTQAFKAWPSMIESSGLTAMQKKRLTAHFLSHPMVAALARRAERKAATAK